MKTALILHGDHPLHGFHSLINPVPTTKHFRNEILLYFFLFWFCTFSFEFSLVFAFHSIFTPLSQAVGQRVEGLHQRPGSKLGECSAFGHQHFV